MRHFETQDNIEFFNKELFISSNKRIILVICFQYFIEIYAFDVYTRLCSISIMHLAEVLKVDLTNNDWKKDTYC